LRKGNSLLSIHMYESDCAAQKQKVQRIRCHLVSSSSKDQKMDAIKVGKVRSRFAPPSLLQASCSWLQQLWEALRMHQETSKKHSWKAWSPPSQQEPSPSSRWRKETGRRSKCTHVMTRLAQHGQHNKVVLLHVGL
jgi:hypothetical protein